jgi:hypothetical protein
MPAKGARARDPAEQAEHVASHCVEPRAACKFALDIGDQGLGRGLRRRKARRLIEQHRVDGQKPPRLLIGGPPHHNAIEPRAMRQRLIEIGDAAVEHDAKTGMRRFEPIDAGIIERRDIPVLARR